MYLFGYMPRTASRNILFSSARISKIEMINVDRVCPSLSVDFQDIVQCASDDDDLQAFIDNSDLIISNYSSLIDCSSGLIFRISSQ